MTLSATAKNAMLDELASLITHVGLSNAGTELTGGSPAYARQAVAFGSAAAGVVAMTGTETFDVAAGSTVNRAILRAHLTSSAVDYGYASLTQEVFGGQGTYQLTALTITLSDP